MKKFRKILSILILVMLFFTSFTGTAEAAETSLVSVDNLAQFSTNTAINNAIGQSFHNNGSSAYVTKIQVWIRPHVGYDTSYRIELYDGEGPTGAHVATSATVTLKPSEASYTGQPISPPGWYDFTFTTHSAPIASNHQYTFVMNRIGSVSGAFALAPDIYSGGMLYWTGTSPKSYYDMAFRVYGDTTQPVNFPPLANTGGPYTLIENESITLDGSGSYDPNGLPITLAWDLDNDGAFDDATGAHPVYHAPTVTALTVKTIKLKVTNSIGLTSVSPTTITIEEYQGTVVAAADDLSQLNSATAINNAIGQTFRLHNETDILKIAVWIQPELYYTTSYNIEIRDGLGSSAPLVATSQSISVYPSDSVGTAGWYVYEFPTQPTLAPNHQYTFILRRLSQYNGAFAMGGNIYPDGMLYWTGTSPKPYNDMAFRIYGEVNLAPTANDQSITTNEDTPKAITLTGSDPENAALSYRVTTNPQHGTLTGTAPALTYIPAADYWGTDSFRFKVNDGSMDSGEGWIRIAVNAANDPPVLTQTALSFTTDDATPLTINPAASDIDSSGLTCVIDNIDLGTAVPSGAGIYYTPPSNYVNYDRTDTVTFRVFDGQAYSGTGTITILVQPSNQPPVADAGIDQIVEQTSLDGTMVTLDGTASTDDGKIQPLSYTWTWASGTTTGINPSVVMPAGTTTVTLTIFDGFLYDSDTVVITVQDTIAPVISAPADITCEATGVSTPVDIGMATATDAVGVISISSDAPAAYPVGTTVVTWTAEDAAGNSASAIQYVTVVDTTAPEINAPADVTMEATGVLTPVTIGTATATDAVGVVSITNDAPAAYPVGTTVVTWTAKDAAGNAASTVQNVTVVDTTAPEIIAPADVTMEATGVLTPVSIGTATATDAVGVVSITSDAPAAYPVGTTIVTWTAKDAAGNAASAVQYVTVVDTTPPVITVPSDITVGSTGLLTIVDLGNVTATDNVGVVSLTSDAPAGYGVGTTVITWTATDAAGNSASAIQYVTVTITYTGTVNTITELVANSSVADALITKIENIRDSEQKKNPKVKDNMVKSFINQVNGQTGKLISPADAELLIMLAEGL